MSKHCHYCKYPNEGDAVYCAECRHPIVKDESGRHNRVLTPVEKNGHTGIPSDGFIVGRTKVKCFRNEVNEQTGRETIVQCHKGVVLSRTNSFVRVYNPEPVAKGGDVSPELSQKFPIQSKRAWVEIVEILDTPQAYKVPPLFR